jgi:hypothetical protein
MASIHDLESQLTDIPPIDTEPRGLFADRIIPGYTTRETFVAGTVQPLRSWAAEPMEGASTAAPDKAHISLHCADLVKTINVAADRITGEWRWSTTQFPVDAWFSTELSYSADLQIDAPGAERWDYLIETVAKSEKGFDRMSQGHATVLRWPANAGCAQVTVSVVR